MGAQLYFFAITAASPSFGDGTALLGWLTATRDVLAEFSRHRAGVGRSKRRAEALANAKPCISPSLPRRLPGFLGGFEAKLGRTYARWARKLRGP